MLTENHHDDDHDDHGGLDRDLPALMDRRSVLRWMGGMSLAGVLAACGVDGATATTADAPVATTAARGSATTAAATATTAAASATTGAGAATVEATAGDEIPDETAGPFPADGSNGPNVLGEEGFVRSDITTSFGGLSGTAEGVPMTIALTVVEADTGAPLPGSVVYLWHCTAGGQYSVYEVSDQNYLRGAQIADDAGRITFTTVFPGCYAGRWPHAHFEVYESADEATAGSSAMKTSQVALPQADCEAVYADSRYGDSSSNLGRLSLASDGVFADGWEDQLAVMSGSMDGGYTASLLVRV